MPYLSAVVRVLDSRGYDIVPKKADGTREPIKLQLGVGLAGEGNDKGLLIIRVPIQESGGISVNEQGELYSDAVALGQVNPEPLTLVLRDADANVNASSFTAGGSVLVDDPPTSPGQTSFTTLGPTWNEADEGNRTAARRLLTISAFTGSDRVLADLDSVVTAGGSAPRLLRDSIAYVDGTVTPLLALPSTDDAIGSMVLVKEYNVNDPVEVYGVAGVTIDDAGAVRTVTPGEGRTFVAIATNKWASF